MTAARPWWKLDWKLSPLGAGRIRVIERTALTTAHTLHLVQIDGETKVLVTWPGGCRQLHAHPEGDS